MATVTHEITFPVIELPETDGEPLDSAWHRAEIHVLIESVHGRFPDRSDFYVGGNMFLYFSFDQVRNRDYRGPDFFYVKGVDGSRTRRYWAVWEEGGKYPNVIIELLSASTANEDRTTKKNLYEQVFRTPEYFLYDPDTQSLEGWRLAGQRYQPVRPNEHGWLWSEQLELWIGTWDGVFLGETATWLRFYDSQGRLVPLTAEAERQQAAAERQRAETERQRADSEHQRADSEHQRAEAERRRAEVEHHRAEAAEAELAHLKAKMSEPGA